MALAELQIDTATGVATIRVNRPEVLNAIDVPTAQAIRDAVLPLDGDARVRCIVLCGAGRAFIAGGDLARFADDFDRAPEVLDGLLDALHLAILTLRRHRAPVLASVHGAVAGAGLSLMAACDLAVAAQGTRFLVAYDRIGASPDCGGTWFLPRVLGERRAAQFMYLSQGWDAETAERYGLVNEVVAADALAARTQQLAQQIASGPTAAFGAYKRLSRQGLDDDGLAAHLEQEREAWRAATHTQDFREGVSAFLAKRPARFTGN